MEPDMFDDIVIVRTQSNATNIEPKYIDYSYVNVSIYNFFFSTINYILINVENH